MLSPRTIELLTDIKFNILACPETFRMESEFQPEKQSPCGTAACIAGHSCAIQFEAEKLVDAQDKTSYGSQSPMALSREFLGLDRKQSERLFYLSTHAWWDEGKWPAKLEKRYWASTTPEDRAKVAAERIDLFIATRGNE